MRSWVGARAKARATARLNTDWTDKTGKRKYRGPSPFATLRVRMTALKFRMTANKAGDQDDGEELVTTDLRPATIF